MEYESSNYRGLRKYREIWESVAGKLRQGGGDGETHPAVSDLWLTQRMCKELSNWGRKEEMKLE